MSKIETNNHIDNAFIGHLKIRSFKIKAENIEFKSTAFTTSEEKKKIYKGFCSFLSNHFKSSGFRKNMYQHLNNHCGFIAHYNIHGFYSEYFNTPAIYHKVAHDHMPKLNECGVSLYGFDYLGKDDFEAKKSFYSIYEKLSTYRDRSVYDGLGGFMGLFFNNEHYGAYREYKDLDTAINRAIVNYFEHWQEEIKKAKKLVVCKPSSLFDFI